MTQLSHEGYGSDKLIPEMILAGASADDVFVLIIFYTFLGFNKGERIEGIALLNIPLSIVLGISLGILLGILLARFYKKIKIGTNIKIFILLSLSLLIVGVENILETKITYSSMLAIISMGMTVLLKDKESAIAIKKCIKDFGFSLK